MENKSSSSKLNTYYGCMVIGPSGSGKTTLCTGLQQFFNGIGRKNVVINLDPANDEFKYQCCINIQDLINIEDTMQMLELGPNGSLVYCFQFLDENFEWLQNKILEYKDHYLIFDMPGQIELYMNQENLKNIVEKLQKNEKFDIRLVSMGLYDSVYCYDYANYVSVCLLALNAQINLETPHLNVLSKIDLMKEFGSLPQRLSFYLNANELGFVSDMIFGDVNESKLQQKYNKLNQEICNMIDNYSLLGFIPLNVSDKMSVNYLIANMDKANGYFLEKEYEKEAFSELRNLTYEQQNILESEMIMQLEEELFDVQKESDDMLEDLEQFVKEYHNQKD